MSCADLLSAARRYIGTPYREYGRNAFGLDCVGLLVRAARDLGITLRDERAYPIYRSNGLLFDGLRRRGLPQTDYDGPGVVVVFRFGPLEHCAISTGEHGIVHSWKRIGRVAEMKCARPWESRVIGRFLLPPGFVRG